MRVATKVLRVAAVLVAAPLAAACDELPFFPGHFEVRVEDAAGRPVAGAVVTGGFDWTFYQVVTDRGGAAAVPRSERDRSARILAVNHFPRHVPALRSQRYRLDPTPVSVAEVGRVEGNVLRLTADELLTFSYHGGLRAYEHGAAGVVERSHVLLPLSTSFAGLAELFGDELWVLRGDRVIEVWSAREPAAPVKLRELTGLGIWLARQDSLVVIRRDPGTEIWAVPDAGAPRKLAALPVRSVAAAFVGPALYLRLLEQTWSGVDLLVADITDPAAPRTVHRETFAGFGRISIGGGRAVLARSMVDPGAAAPAASGLAAAAPAASGLAAAAPAASGLAAVAPAASGLAAVAPAASGLAAAAPAASGVAAAAPAPVEHLVLDLADPLRPVRAGTLLGDAYLTDLLPGDGDLAVGFTTGPHVEALLHVDWPAGRVRVLTATELETAHVWPYPNPLPDGAVAGSTLLLARRLWRLPATSP
jgi:hypothetical protein